jgi:hypothetical protein
MILSGYCSDSLKQITTVLIFLRIQEQWTSVPLQSNPAVFTKWVLQFFILYCFVVVDVHFFTKLITSDTLRGRKFCLFALVM